MTEFSTEWTVWEVVLVGEVACVDIPSQHIFITLLTPDRVSPAGNSWRLILIWLTFEYFIANGIWLQPHCSLAIWDEGSHRKDLRRETLEPQGAKFSIARSWEEANDCGGCWGLGRESCPIPRQWSRHFTSNKYLQNQFCWRVRKSILQVKRF